MTRSEAEYRVLASLGKGLDWEWPSWALESEPGAMSFPRALHMLIRFLNGSSSLWTKQHDDALRLLVEHVEYQDYRIQSLKKQLYRAKAGKFSRASARMRVLP